MTLRRQWNSGVTWTWIVPALLGIVAATAAVWTCDGPGLTVDEPINVSSGCITFNIVANHPFRLVQPEVIQGLWGGAHDYPPLPRTLLGASHTWGQLGSAKETYQWKLARPASAVAFGILVFFVSRLATGIAGTFAGLTAGVACATMPRLYGHAQLASAEVITAAAFLMGLSSAAWAMAEWQRGRAGHRWLSITAAGMYLGIALLTKLTAALLPIAVAVTWFFFRGQGARSRGQQDGMEVQPLAPSNQSPPLPIQNPKSKIQNPTTSPPRHRLYVILPLTVYLFLGFATFFALWPWMWPFTLPGYSDAWLGSWERLREYVLTGVERATIYVDYFGRQYPNEAGGVPWHFVWVFFFVTVPLATHVFAFVGLPTMFRSARTKPAAGLVFVVILMFLGVFTLPIDRYDSERLFLPIFPVWAVVAGVGASTIVNFVASRVRSNVVQWSARAACVIFAASGVVAIVRLHPYELSYFNVAIGGLSGADRLGLEVTYWGDSLTDEILDAFAAQADKGERAVLLPTLVDMHAIVLSNVATKAKELRVLPPDRADFRTRWAIVFHRDGYLHDELSQRVLTLGECKAEVSREGVWLSRLYRLPDGFSWTVPSPPRP